MIKDINGKDIIKLIDNNDIFIGKVISNKNFDKDFSISCYIPEINYNNIYTNQEIISNENINKSNFITSSDININSTIKTSNTTIVYPIIINDVIIKPEVGDEIFIKFLDGDYKKPFYLNFKINVNKNNILVIDKKDGLSIKNNDNEIILNKDGIELKGKIKINGKEIK